MATESEPALVPDAAIGSILLISFVGTMGTNVLSPALPGITEGLHVSDAQVGLVITTFKLSAMFVIPVTSFLADLYGRRPIVVPSLCLFGIAGTAMFAAQSFAALLVMSVVLGAGFAGFMPLSIAIIGDFYTGASGSTAQGLRVAVNGIGGMVFPALTGLLAGIAWNQPFLLFLGAFPAAVVTYRYLPERNVSPTRTPGIVEPIKTYARSIRVELIRPEMRILFGSGFLRDFVRYGVIAFVPLFAVRELGASLFAAGLVLSIRGLAALVVSPSLGILVSSTSRKHVLVASFLLSGAGVVTISVVPSVVWLGVAFGLYAVGDALASPVVKDTVTDAATERYRAGVVGGLTVVKSGGQALAPAFFGVIIAIVSLQAVFLFAAAMAVAYGLVVYAVLDPTV